MTSVTDDLPLAAEFPQSSHEDWRKLVDGVLKGATNVCIHVGYNGWQGVISPDPAMMIAG